MRSARFCAAAIALSLMSGCVDWAFYFIRDTHEPIDALEVRMDPEERRECLVVLLPGVFDTADAFLRNGFIEDAARQDRSCDFVAVDAHVGYYNTNTLRERVGRDILIAAEMRGYREIWLVGISMGGLGSMLLARDYPELVEGVVLLAPWLGDANVVQGIERAGGLAEWEPPEIRDPYSQNEFAAALWAWMQGYGEHPERMPQLYVGVGTDDRLLETAGLLRPVVPQDRFATADGGHQWSTWRVLWRRLLEDPPWGERARE
jgi:pimeloyl-ACP methyl ester carboxylesterase